MATRGPKARISALRILKARISHQRISKAPFFTMRI
jgi:hypothetical protein